MKLKLDRPSQPSAGGGSPGPAVPGAAKLAKL
jgi:hypothetical protein